MINDITVVGEWKIHLSIAIDFMSSKDTDETKFFITSKGLEKV